MVTTVQLIVNDALGLLSHSPGVSTQTYATPRMRLFVEQAFFEMFDAPEHIWLGYRKKLTGVPVQNGALTIDLVGAHGIKIEDYKDVIHVWHPDGGDPLPEVSSRRSTASYFGGGVVGIEPSTAIPFRPFVIWPADYTETVDILVRSRPSLPFSLSQAIYLDHQALVFGAVWAYSTDLGNNPGQSVRYETRFRKRMQEMLQGEQRQAIALDTRLSTIPTTWRDT